MKTRKLIEQWHLPTKYYILPNIQRKSTNQHFPVHIWNCRFCNLWQETLNAQQFELVWKTYTICATHTHLSVEILLQLTAQCHHLLEFIQLFSLALSPFCIFILLGMFKKVLLAYNLSHKICTKFSLTKCPILYMFHTTTRLVIPSNGKWNWNGN